MHRILQSFFERLTERIVAMAGSMVASTVEVERTTQQARQLSQLEDLARQMDAEGKEDIAESIRARMQRHVEDDPGSSADRLIQNVVVDSAVPRLEQSEPSESLSKSPPAKKKTRKSASRRRRSGALPPLNLPTQPNHSEVNDDTH